MALLPDDSRKEARRAMLASEEEKRRSLGAAGQEARRNLSLTPQPANALSLNPSAGLWDRTKRFAGRDTSAEPWETDVPGRGGFGATAKKIADRILPEISVGGERVVGGKPLFGGIDEFRASPSQGVQGSSPPLMTSRTAFPPVSSQPVSTAPVGFDENKNMVTHGPRIIREGGRTILTNLPGDNYRGALSGGNSIDGQPVDLATTLKRRFTANAGGKEFTTFGETQQQRAQVSAQQQLNGESNPFTRMRLNELAKGDYGAKVAEPINTDRGILEEIQGLRIGSADRKALRESLLQQQKGEIDRRNRTFNVGEGEKVIDGEGNLVAQGEEKTKDFPKEVVDLFIDPNTRELNQGQFSSFARFANGSKDMFSAYADWSQFMALAPDQQVDYVVSLGTTGDAAKTKPFYLALDQKQQAAVKKRAETPPKG